MSRHTVSVRIEARQIVAPVWHIDRVKWTGNAIRCPRCRRKTPATALMDIVQYGMIDKDLCTTLFDCGRCGKSFAVEYSINWGEGIEESEEHNG